LEDEGPVLTSELKGGKTYTISQNLEEIEVAILKGDQKFEIKARPKEMEAQIRTATSLEGPLQLLNAKGRTVPPSKLSQGKQYRLKTDRDERHNCLVKWNEEVIQVNIRDSGWEMQRLSLKAGKHIAFWKNDQKRAFCQLQPGETYELKAEAGPQWQPRPPSSQPREPRFWVRLIINNADHREGFKRSNMIRELPAVILKLGGPIPYENRDETKRQIWINEMTAEGRYVIQAETTGTISIQGLADPIEVVIGSGKRTAQIVQKLSGMDRPVMLVDEGGNRVLFSKIEADRQYRMVVDDTVWDQREVQWGDQQRTLKFKDWRMFWGQIMKWAKRKMYLVNQEGVEVDLLKTKRTDTLRIVDQWDVKTRCLTPKWRNQPFTLNFNPAEVPSFWREFRTKWGIKSQRSGWRYELGRWDGSRLVATPLFRASPRKEYEVERCNAEGMPTLCFRVKFGGVIHTILGEHGYRQWVDRQLRAITHTNWRISTKEGRMLMLNEIWDDDDYTLTRADEEVPTEHQISTTEVQKDEVITVYWGIIPQKIEYTGDRVSFHEKVRSVLNIGGEFELKTGIDDHEHEFEFRKNEICHVVEVLSPAIEVEAWSPPEEGGSEPPPVQPGTLEVESPQEQSEGSGLEPPPVQLEESEPVLGTDADQTLISSANLEDTAETVLQASHVATEEPQNEEGFRMISGTKGHSAHIKANGDHWIDLNLVPFLMDGLRVQALKGTVEIFHQGHQWTGEPIEAMDLVEMK
jgi:hypothetical protein